MPPPSFPISQQARLRKHVDRLATERAPTVKRHEAAPLGRERQIDGLVAKRIPGSLVPEPAPTGGQALPQGRATDAHRVTGGDVDLDNPQTPLKADVTAACYRKLRTGQGGARYEERLGF